MSDTATGTTTTGLLELGDPPMLVTLSQGGGIATCLNFSAAKMYVLFDPPNPDTDTAPDTSDDGVFVVPGKCFRSFRRTKGRPVVALVWGAANQFTLDTEAS